MAHIRSPYGHGAGNDHDSDYVSLAPLTANTDSDDCALQNEHGHSPPEPRRRNLAQRLSWQHLSALFLGSAMIPLVFLFLGLLWRESTIAAAGAEPRTPWIRILRASWAPSAVTICTAIIRTFVALQASLVTAMLTGFILETTGAPLSQAPFFAIIRAVDVSPTNLLSTTVFRSRGVLSIVYGLVVAEILISLATQFLSTIFLSDFADSSFANMEKSTAVPVVERPNIVSGVPDWWTVSPASSWTFAELPDSFAEGRDFHDTGHTYRAFLPFQDAAQRESLRKFRGPVIIMDQRVVCGRPSLTNLTVDQVSRLSGTVTMDTSSWPMLNETETQQHISFSCGVPGAFSGGLTTTDGQSSLCFVGSDQQWTVLLEDPLVDPSLYTDPGERASARVPAASTMFMILDIVTWDAFAYGAGARRGVEVIRNDGPWATVTNGSAAVEALRLTTCFTNLGARTFIADMHSSHSRQEPKLAWDRLTQGYDAGSSLHQLGASSNSTRSPAGDDLRDRGVLQLGPRSQWQDFDYQDSIWSAWFFSTNLMGSTYFINPLASDTPENQTADAAVMFSKYMSNVKNSAHKSHTAVFRDALQSTESPALAAQALFARMHQMAYYDALPNANRTAAAPTSFSVSALIPVRWTGFASAAALMAAQFALVLVVAVMFLRSTRHSLLGNHWQAISQVVSEDTLPVLRQADRMGDRDVETWAESQSVDLQSYAVLRRQRDGRVALGARDSATLCARTQSEI
ncbi:hypothetical protein ACRE_090720 [Hapsidospora chrysogenum ATCC 11550]|uniref:Uncharacterized protein n=1 Tax=Hapsidospora chrysogenum (strain ATCC 11550 / CBS 779.69 / DSM 880 / IAM 14645 / JCM 23072 / IMI 49137) TaxID=857340 RepID=A0A086ST36_HAPC1|nr:hypothetical protein ACRE_090720 [Hapsidospora chrysogenum ATCC 11550]